MNNSITDKIKYYNSSHSNESDSIVWLFDEMCF